METKRRGEIGRQLASRGDGTPGPSYADVRWLADVVEREHDVHLTFQVCPAEVHKRWSYGQFWVRCDAYRRLDPQGRHVYGGAAWGGNSGARTMPGAMVSALLNAEERLTDIETDELNSSP